MLIQQMVVLGNIPVIKIGYPHIEDNIEKEREVQKRKIETVLFRSHCILYRPVNTQNPKRLNEKVKEHQ
jgi:hypothetical protein